MSWFARGDCVRLVTLKGIEDIPPAQRPRLQDEAYWISDVRPAAFAAIGDAILLGGYEYLGWWSGWRFEKVAPPADTRNPCAEVEMTGSDIDWKSRYENLHQRYKELEIANYLNRNAIRLQREARENAVRLQREAREKAEAEVRTLKAAKTINPGYVRELEETAQAYRSAIRPMLPEHLEQPIRPADARAATERYRRMDRALFLATHYNWSRKGLTWEEVARDMLNYALQGLGQGPLPRTEKLIPPKSNTFLGSAATAAKLYVGDKLVGSYDNLQCDVFLDRPLSPETCTGCAEDCSHPNHKR